MGACKLSRWNGAVHWTHERIDCTYWMCARLRMSSRGGVNVLAKGLQSKEEKREKDPTFRITMKKLSVVHVSLPLRSPCQMSTSTEDGRMRYMPLVADKPLMTFPAGQASRRLLSMFCSWVWYIQFVSGTERMPSKYASAGISALSQNRSKGWRQLACCLLICMWTSPPLPPASRTRILVVEFSKSLLASTRPARPPLMITKSGHRLEQSTIAC